MNVLGSSSIARSRGSVRTSAVGWYLAVILLAAGMGAALVFSRGILAWVTAPAVMWFLVYALARVLLANRPELLRSAIRWAGIVFTIHLIVGIGISYVPGAQVYFGPDADTYHRGAATILDSGSSGSRAFIPFPLSGKEGFVYTLAGVYSFFGPFVIAGLALNAALAAAVAPLLVDATDRLFDRPAARYVGPIVAFVPSFIIFQSQLLREAGVMFLLALAMNAAVRLTYRVHLTSVATATAALAALFTFRGFVAPLAMGGLIAGIILSRRDLVRGATTGAAVIGLIAFVVFGLGVGYSGYQTVASADLQVADTVRRASAVSASSGFDARVDLSTSTGALSYLPVGQLRFWTGPFPWEVLSPRHAPAALDVLVWWCLLPFLVAGICVAWRERYSRALLLGLPALAIAGAVSLVIGNYGTLIRERAMVILLLAPLIALGLARRRAESR